jgi:hypothetical protein
MSQYKLFQFNTKVITLFKETIQQLRLDVFKHGNCLLSAIQNLNFQLKGFQKQVWNMISYPASHILPECSTLRYHEEYY